jgi:hypothetical protein
MPDRYKVKEAQDQTIVYKYTPLIDDSCGNSEITEGKGETVRRMVDERYKNTNVSDGNNSKLRVSGNSGTRLNSRQGSGCRVCQVYGKCEGNEYDGHECEGMTDNGDDVAE